MANESHQQSHEDPSADHARQPILPVVAAYMFGIGLDCVANLSVGFYGFCAIATSIGLIVMVSSKLRKTLPVPRCVSVVVLTLFALLGAARHHAYWNWYPENEIGFWTDVTPQAVAMKVTLLTEVRQVALSENTNLYRERGETADRLRVLVRCDEIRDGTQWTKVTGRVWLTFPATDVVLSAGDQIQVFGKLVGISGPSNPGQYDFATHMRRQRILAALYCFDTNGITRIQASEHRFVSRIRRRLNEIAWENLAPDKASFASAILLGNRQQITPERREEFLKTGTIHLLAISGLHVGILAGFIYGMFRTGVCGRSLCLLMTILFVVGYAWLVEFRPPVVRATIFIVLFCIARLVGRGGNAFNILALAALVVLVLNPTDLFALGTQLSFLAVAAITFGKDLIFAPVTDPLDRMIASTRPWPQKLLAAVQSNFRAAFVVSGLVWLISIPLVACQFHVLAPVGLIVNPIMLIPIAMALYSGLTILVFGDFVPIIAKIAAVFCTISLSFSESVVGVAGQLPVSHVWTPGPSPIAVAVFYALWVVFGLFSFTRIDWKSLCVLGLVWLLCGWFLPVQIRQWWRTSVERSLVVTVMDVGHGSAVLMELPDGKNVVYDCGSTSSARFATGVVSGVLWSKGIQHLDALVISHADFDHYSGVEGIVDRFSIGKVLTTSSTLSSKAEAVEKLMSKLNGLGIPVRAIKSGDAVGISTAVDFQVLGPNEAINHSNDNSSSLILSATYQGRAILLPGDLERAGLEDLLQRSALDYDLLMAAHHGSRNSDPTRFMKWATPEFVAVSCGSGKFPSSSAQLFAGDGRVVKSTNDSGAIEFIVSADGGIQFNTFLDGAIAASSR